MDDKIKIQCLDSITNSESVGYSYVKSFVDTLWINKDILGINNYVVLWRVYFDTTSKPMEFRLFSNDQEFDLSSLDIDKLFSHVGYLTSDSKQFKDFYVDESFLQSCIYAIPINNYLDSTSFFKTVGLVLLFSQQGKILISNEDLGAFSYLLNTRKPNVMNSSSIVDTLCDLSLSEDKIYSKYTDCFKHIGVSLDKISRKATNLSKVCGLRHFSLWNYIHANEDIKTKLFSRNTYKDNAHSDTNLYVKNEDNHFINDALLFYRRNEEGVQILKSHSFNEIEPSFVDCDYLRGNNLGNTNTTVLTVADGDMGFDLNCPDRIINFYIANIVYTPFISKSFVKIFSKAITNSIRKCLVTCRDDILTSLIDASINYSNEKTFYGKAQNIIKEANEAEDVLIYLKNDEKIELKNSNTNSFLQNLEFSIPDKFKEKEFEDWLKKCFKSKHLNSFYINKDSKNVHSAAFMRADTEESSNRDCFVILINKLHKPSQSCVYYNNIFDKDNYYITSKCCVFLIQYQKMQDSIRNKNYLLKKLRHEIPSCTEAIENGLADIRKALDSLDVSRNLIFSITNNMALNNSRVLLLAKFFSTVDFELEQFAKEKININLNSFLGSYIEIFRTEGVYKGVDVYFEMKDKQSVNVFASNYFQLAIVNVITNAIRYAASGTCVCIDVYLDKIIVRDLGIGILPSERNLIFNEGYRGRDAKRTNEKGMGYGLFLTQKVLAAHGFDIDVESSLYSQQNYFAQAAVMRFLETLSVPERKQFVLKDMDEAEVPMALDILKKISISPNIIADKKDYGNVKLETIKSWIQYISENNLIFYDMDQVYFQDELYEVSFAIKF